MTAGGKQQRDGKANGAMLAIGELADHIGVQAHVLRYWETRFPQLRPLQRSGRRRYYRPEDVALAERIHHLLHVKGYTIDGARKALAVGNGAVGNGAAPSNGADASHAVAPAPGAGGVPVESLVALRQRLAAALG